MKEHIQKLRALQAELKAEQDAAQARGAGHTGTAYGVAASKLGTAARYLEEALEREQAEPSFGLPEVTADPAPVTSAKSRR